MEPPEYYYIDNSGSTAGVSFYWNHVENIVTKYENPTVVFWNQIVETTEGKKWVLTKHPPRSHGGTELLPVIKDLAEKKNTEGNYNYRR